MRSFSNYIVNIARLKNNVKNIKNLVGEKTKLCAVVKANAYGVGVKTVCEAVSEYVDFFAVSSVVEAMEIRQFNNLKPILVLGVVSFSDLSLCSKNNISISVGNLKYLKELEQFREKLKLHIQINTGLNRYGVSSTLDYKKMLNIINKRNNFALGGVYSHFATKGNDLDFIEKQFNKFNEYKKLTSKNVIFHIANSFANLESLNYRIDMVRNGFLMYGEMKNSINNSPVVSITSKIVNILDVKKGETVGYDRTFLAKKNMKIGVVPLGYADGIDRRLSNSFYVLVGGKKCKIVGLVCMDVFMIDVTSVKVNLFDEVVILGDSKDKRITLNDMAEVLKTSPYEVLLKLNYRRMNYITKQ